MTAWGPTCRPTRPGVTSFFLKNNIEKRHDRHLRANEIGSDGNAWSLTRRGAAIPRHRPHGVPDRGRSVRHAGDPPLADPALQRNPRRDGLCGQCEHHGHGGRGARGRLPEPAYRPPARHSRKPGPARDPHHAAGERPRSNRVHDPAHRAGPLHGLGVCADAGLSRRAMQFDGCRRRVRRLYHRQRRQQSDRAAGVGRIGRYARAGLELLFLRAAQSCRRGAGLLHHPARQADACDAHGAIAVRRHDRALAQPGAALGLRHRLLHPVCLYRHLHLRQFCAGARAAVARTDGSRPGLFRVRALRRHDAVRRQGGGALRHAAGDLGRARGRRSGPAADAVLASARRF